MAQKKEPVPNKKVVEGLRHKKVTFTLPPDVVETIEKSWRFHPMLDGEFAGSRSAFVADLVRRKEPSKVKRAKKN